MSDTRTRLESLQKLEHGLDRLVENLEILERDGLKASQTRLDEHTKSVIRTPWLARTRWLERFVGVNMLELSELSEKPKEDGWVQDVWKDVGEMMNMCYVGMKDIDKRLWERILFWLASPNRERSSKEPMNLYLQSTTVEAYSIYWQRFICFCLRVTDTNLAVVKFTEQQKEELDLLRVLYEARENGSMMVAEKKKRILLCSIRFIKQTVYEVGLPALVYFAGILGYEKETGTWRKPERYTNILAGILWCMRVLVLEYTLPNRNRDRLAEEELTPLERFKLVRDQFLVEEADCPFATLHTLMNYGFVLAKDAVGRTGISWSANGQILYIRGQELSMRVWKDFLFGLVEKVELRLAKELMFRKDGRLPDFNLWNLKDDQGMINVGYYLGRRDDREWSMARKDMLSWNSSMEDPYGLIVEETEDGIRFEKTGVDEYKRMDREFRMWLYILFLGTCGPPPRTTEMTSLKFMNSIFGTRNIFVTGGQVMFVTEYHKSEAITKRQKVSLLKGGANIHR